jgi:hypothetical protein
MSWRGVNPSPFILPNVVLSFRATFAAPVITISRIPQATAWTPLGTTRSTVTRARRSPPSTRARTG